MVKLEEVEEDTYPDQPNTFNPEDEDGWDTDDSGISLSLLHPPHPSIPLSLHLPIPLLTTPESSLSSLSSSASEPPSETLSDRLYALKDIIPPHQRRTLASLSAQSYNWGAWGLGGGLKLTWQICTSTLLLVVPFSLVMMEDQAMAAEEAQFKMREQGSEVCSFFSISFFLGWFWWDVVRFGMVWVGFGDESGNGWARAVPVLFTVC